MEPLMLASVRTRVVSWKLAAEMKLSVESDESQATSSPLLVRPHDGVNVSPSSAIVRLRQALTVLHPLDRPINVIVRE
jgi:hypothetical protein